MRELLRRLAGVEPGDLPVLSVYLDMRPEATGESPGLRSGLIVLKDRLREIEKTLLPRGPALDSFREDAGRIEAFVEDERDPVSEGLAIVACAGRGLFEVVEAGVPFRNQVSANPAPDLFQLARLLDEQETAVVALVDSNTARLFVSRVGALEERGGPDDDSVSYRKRAMGGWSQARYQRHIDKHRSDFAGEVGRAIETLVEQEGAVRVILAGDEVALTPLQQALPSRVAALVVETVRLDIRAPRDAVREEVAPLLSAAEAEEARDLADRLIDAVRSDGLGVIGWEQTEAALTAGQVDLLLLDPEAALGVEDRSELVRLAALTGATVEVVSGHDDLRALGGVGALLRYRQTERDRDLAPNAAEGAGPGDRGTVRR